MRISIKIDSIKCHRFKNIPIDNNYTITMAFVRTFLVQNISAETTLEQFRDTMEYLGSVCRIDVYPKQNTETWGAFVYYESWKPCEETQLIDNKLHESYKNLLCFMRPYNNTVILYKTPNRRVRLWKLLRNTSAHQYSFIPRCIDESLEHRLIRFIPKNYSLNISIEPSHHEYTDDYLMWLLRSHNIGEIAHVQKIQVLFNENSNEPKLQLIVHFNKWYVSETNMRIHDKIEKNGVMYLYDESQDWTMTDYSDLVTLTVYPINECAVEEGITWVRPNRHMYF